MRLFLYLLALVVGFSPAQASSVSLAEPVAVACKSVDASAIGQVRAVAPHAVLAPAGAQALPAIFVALSGEAPAFVATASELSDRPLE